MWSPVTRRLNLKSNGRNHKRNDSAFYYTTVVKQICQNEINRIKSEQKIGEIVEEITGKL